MTGIRLAQTPRGQRHRGPLSAAKLGLAKLRHGRSIGLAPRALTGPRPALQSLDPTQVQDKDGGAPNFNFDVEVAAPGIRVAAPELLVPRLAD